MGVEAYPLGYSLVFCEHLAPEEVLVRLGARREALYPLTRLQAQDIEVRNAADEPWNLDHLGDLDVAALEELGFLRSEVDAVVRAGSAGGWAYAIQASVSYVSARNHLPALSRGTRVLAVSRDVNATQRVEYAVVDGRVLSSFDPGIPAYDDGVEPSALGWPSDSGGMTSPQVLEYLERRFALSVPDASEGLALPAAAFSRREA
ncbi:DUF6461 domain-containing protein [Streptomyces sp. NPDC005402]|uniref:DUF6461 domain-containing protein n=1 Tax=Streptomyces sp. NPDC005402 TaxID=3155338 RepID=UPI0033BAF975